MISGGKIASIEIVSTSDGSSYISKASAITGKIVSSQSTNVDTVSGATYSSVGTSMRFVTHCTGGSRRKHSTGIHRKYRAEQSAESVCADTICIRKFPVSGWNLLWNRRRISGRCQGSYRAEKSYDPVRTDSGK